jgi:hypothetical protein
MQKTVVMALALLTASASFAQQKKQPPPPPPPPQVKLATPPAPPKVTREQLPSSGNTDYQAFLKANPTVKSLGWSRDKVHVHLKSGKDETYNLHHEADMLNLHNKYGELPAPPPPPPPPPIVRKVKSKA